MFLQNCLSLAKSELSSGGASLSFPWLQISWYILIPSGNTWLKHLRLDGTKPVVCTPTESHGNWCNPDVVREIKSVQFLARLLKQAAYIGLDPQFGMLKIFPLEQTLSLGQRWLGPSVLTLNIFREQISWAGLCMGFCGICGRKVF